MLTKKQALQLIEAIISSDAMQDLEYKRIDKGLTKDEKFLLDRVGNVYKIAHSTLGECKNKHTDWQEEAIASFKIILN